MACCRGSHIENSNHNRTIHQAPAKIADNLHQVFFPHFPNQRSSAPTDHLLPSVQVNSPTLASLPSHKFFPKKVFPCKKSFMPTPVKKRSHQSKMPSFGNTELLSCCPGQVHVIMFKHWFSSKKLTLTVSNNVDSNVITTTPTTRDCQSWSQLTVP